jgi:hypothetical protein
MSEVLKCDSCGGTNQLPEGKNSMFCAFCGSAIELKAIEIDSKRETKTSNIKSKPELKYGTDEYEDNPVVSVSLVNRDIDDVSELINWFTDDELKEITHLNLSNNNILDLKKLNAFPNLENVILDNNRISELDLCIPMLSYLSLKNNKIKQIDHNFFNFINNYITLDIYLDNNPIERVKIPSEFEYEPTYKTFIQQNNIGGGMFSKKYFKSIFKEYDGYLYDKVRNLDYRYKIDSGRMAVNSFIKFCNQPIITIYHNSKEAFNNPLFEYNKNNDKSYSQMKGPEINKEKFLIFLKEEFYEIKDLYDIKLQKEKKIGCFIATAAMGSYDHPQVMELRHFRDEWILTKNWGESFVNWYYHYGEKAAKLIDKSNILKQFSYLLIVKPLVYLSRILK